MIEITLPFDRSGIVCPAATILELDAIAMFWPDILQLACHGDGANPVFEDGFGQRRAVRALDVMNLLATYRRRPT